MSIFTEVSIPIKTIGNVLDRLFTSKEELLTKQAILDELKIRIDTGQIQINKIEAFHNSIFVAGWRPAIGWTCAAAIFYEFIFRPIVGGFGLVFPLIQTEGLYTLATILLGAQGLRTIERIKKK